MEEHPPDEVQRQSEPSDSASYNTNFVDRVVRRRIAISLTCFLCLIIFNLIVQRTLPYSPLDVTQPGSIVSMSFVLAGLAIRSWAAGTLHKSAEVTSIGPYALVRNPLYVGSFLMMFGFCILMKDWLALAFAIGPLAVLYWFQVKVEERNLSNWFSTSWEQYAARTGRFFPRRINSGILSGWAASQWLKNREYQAIFATLAGLMAIALVASR